MTVPPGLLLPPLLPASCDASSEILFLLVFLLLSCPGALAVLRPSSSAFSFPDRFRVALLADPLVCTA
eukprot:7236100-Prymnesium_polylepis.1